MMETMGHEPPLRAEPEPAEFPPPPLGEDVPTQWTLSPLRVLLRRMRQVAIGAVGLWFLTVSLLLFEVLCGGGSYGTWSPTGGGWVLWSPPPAVRCVVILTPLAFGLAVLHLSWPPYRELRGLAVRRDGVVLMPLFGRPYQLAPAAISGVAFGPLARLRLGSLPLACCLVPRLPVRLAKARDLVAALERVGVRTRRTWW